MAIDNETDSSAMGSSPGEEDSDPMAAASRSVVWTKMPQVTEANTANADEISTSMAKSLLKQMGEVCTDWKSPDHPISLQLVYEAPKHHMELFKQWLQDIIVTQSQKFPGYQGTVMYQPDRKTAERERLQNMNSYIVETRYQGAHNFKAWLESEERTKLVSYGFKAGLWDPAKTFCKIQEGTVLAVDSIWTAAEADDTLVDTRKPELAKWRLSVFTGLSVWLTILLFNWPEGGIGKSISKAVGGTLGIFLSQGITVVAVQWISAPLMQPYLMWWLLQKRPKLKLWHVEPMVTLYEGFPCFRHNKPKKESPPEVAAPSMAEAGSVKQTTPRSPSAGFDFEELEQVQREAETVLSALDSLASTAAQADAPVPFRPVQAAEGYIAIVLKEHVRPNKFEEFESVAKNLGSAVTNFSPHEYVGTTLVRPTPGSNLYTVIVRFKNRKAVEAWMGSDERKSLASAKNRLTYSPAEARASTHTALDLLLTDRSITDADGTPHGGQDRLSPAVYKTALLVWACLFSTTQLLGLATKHWHWLHTLKFPWAALMNNLMAVPIMSYVAIPAVSTLIHRWLDMPRPGFYKHTFWKELFIVRWVWEGLNKVELSWIFGTAIGLLIGFGASGKLHFPY